LNSDARIETDLVGYDAVGTQGGGSMKVSMFGTLRLATGGVTETQVHIAGRCTAREALNQLAVTYPGLSQKVFGEGQELKRGLNLFVKGRSIRLLDGLNTLLQEGDDLVLLPLLGGG
jgi:molybdopterin converting factor small subunit